ncbi:MAG: hypothetical protein KJT03_23485, partial [Verrucomicrobiae bacterium]|nr:hypothetical protein [Verrucomicrobiae bacterium]
ERIPLTPIDGTQAKFKSAKNPDGPLLEGFLDYDLSDLSMNSNNQVVFNVSLFPEESSNSSIDGLHKWSEETGLWNIALQGDPAPGLTDVVFETFFGALMAENGNVLFTTMLGGTGATSGANQALWLESDGQLSLMLHESSPAPGMPGYSVNLTGNLNMLVLEIADDITLIGSGVQKPGDQASLAYWLGNTTNTELVPFLQVDSSPNLNDPSVFKNTSEGPVAFTQMDNNSIRLDETGNVYFDAVGKLSDDSTISGIWKSDSGSGNTTLLNRQSFADGWLNLELLESDDAGRIFFLAEKDGVKGVWIRAASGERVNIASVGDGLEGRTIVDFANLSNRTLGEPKLHNLTDQSGNFIFVARFDDANGDNKRDEGIFVAGLVPEPTNTFVWSGEAGNGDWHTLLNWDDGETGLDAD